MLSSSSSVTPIDTPKYVTSAPPSPNSSLASTPTNATFAKTGPNPLTSRVPTKYGTPPHESPGSPLTGSYPPSASNSAAPSPLLSAFSSSISGNPRHKRHRRDSSAPLIGTPPIFNTEAENGELAPYSGFSIHSGSESGAAYGRVSMSTPRPLSPGAAALGPLSPTFTRGNLLSDKFNISNEEDNSGSEDTDSVSEAALSDTENDNKPLRVKLLQGASGNGSTDTNAFGNADVSPTRGWDGAGFGGEHGGPFGNPSLSSSVSPIFLEDEVFIGLSRQKIHLPEEDLENQWGETTIEHTTHRYYGGAIGTVFSTEQVGEELLKLGPEPMASRLLGERRYLNPSETLNYLHLLDYRYLRMAYHPGLRRFLQTGYWKDPAWTSAKTLRNGLTREQHRERKSVFDENLIDVKEKPILKLLVDEVGVRVSILWDRLLAYVRIGWLRGKTVGSRRMGARTKEVNGLIERGLRNWNAFAHDCETNLAIGPQHSDHPTLSHFVGPQPFLHLSNLQHYAMVL
ncbi:hypothetical protein BC937DRAFT_94589 [Endogone sp. FLAS-F59071]|nr:hypothetical protein BC937DRAFT_94589 [Endogone sp. FLAS-F59071]|eukprot:RUS13929.1 hypothetical protein BC937DRAFT_94589 [Endogone sp. FLAS-F59071]